MESEMGKQEREGGTASEPELKRQKSSGSVKRARERAALVVPADGRDPLEPAPLRITPNRTLPRASTPNEQPAPNYPQAEASPSSQASAGMTPTTPNWPPAFDSTSERVGPSSTESRTPRGPPPKRPPRPDYVPPLPTQAAGQQPSNYWENEFTPPADGSSRSVGSPGRPGVGLSTTGIPEFPIAFTSQAAHQPRRNLGPPPSARKGGANFYLQNAFVAPIPEEQSEAHSSFASSHVMLTSWGDGPPEYIMGSGISEEDEDELHSPSSTVDGRDSRAGDHDESTGLVRKVSIGKPGKPALKSVKGDGAPDDHPKTGQEVQFGPGAGVATFLAPSSNTNSPEATPDEKVVDYEKTMGHSQSGTASPRSPVDPRVAKILGGLEKGGALSTAATTPMTSTHPSMSDRGGKRPARLQLASTKQSEPRGSATSLPELIRRATRLASNLDRGKTASRIGMLEMLEKEKSRRPSRSGSISDILAAFPSPSLHTPLAQSPRFPSPLARSGLHHDFTATPDQSEYSKAPRGRKCCGLPLWAFILLCIILLLLIAAAVIIPITLIVLPRQNNPAPGTVASCRKNSPCANGGLSVVQAGSCRCICMNGFTGASCSVGADSGCITDNIKTNDKENTVYSNATIGTSIPRLFTSASSNYSIPLDPSIILALFSSRDLDCSDQNALVTFNGNPQRKKRTFIPSSSSHPRHLASDEFLVSRHPTRTSPIDAQAIAIAKRASPAQAAVTANGLVFAAPSAAVDPNPVPQTQATLSSSPSPSSTSTSTSTTNNKNTNKNTPTIQSASRPLTPNVLDFARIAILYILQERDLETAFAAQESIQTVFSPAAPTSEGGEGREFNATAKDVGGGIGIDWERLSVDLGNGGVSGGQGGGGG